jgi:heterotetrameric sarcosine oxidase delta subunit
VLRIPCSTCGLRSVEEFRWGGAMPHVPEWITGEANRNVDYVWFLDNDAATITERWFHEAGCRRWSTVQRDTTTDEVIV